MPFLKAIYTFFDKGADKRHYGSCYNSYNQFVNLQHEIVFTNLIIWISFVQILSLHVYFDLIFNFQRYLCSVYCYVQGLYSILFTSILLRPIIIEYRLFIMQYILCYRKMNLSVRAIITVNSQKFQMFLKFPY